MRLSYEQLLAYDIPEVRQRYDEKDAAFYALSVGAGQDPLNAALLRFTDPRRDDFAVLPSMAVVLGYPGFWLAHPDVGADVVRLLHGEQSVEMVAAALPRAAEVIGKTRVVRAVDKGDKGLLLYSEKRLTDAVNGELLAITRATHVLRGDGGIGGPQASAHPPHPMPGGEPSYSARIATRPEQALFYRLNGDYNPLHADPAIARSAGYERPILHGLCTFGLLAQALAERLRHSENARLVSLGLRFTAALYPGETLRLDLWADGSFRATAIERAVVVADNGLAVWRPDPKEAV